jgi:hypothetical protein
MAKTWPGYQHCWAAEENPASTGVHIHGYLYIGEDDPPLHLHHDKIQQSRDRAGFGQEYNVEPIPAHAGAAWFSYPMKDLANPDRAARFLDLNGNPGNRMLIHSSQGFWRDASTGEHFNRAEAEKRAYAQRRMNSAS